MRIAIVASIVMLLTSSMASASAPEVLWTRTFGGPSYEWAWSVEETSDSGYVVAGYTASTSHGDRDIYIVKLRPNGDTIWTKTYGAEQADDVAYSVKQTKDGGLILGGYGTGQYGAESANFYLLKLFANGSMDWENDYDLDSTTNYGSQACETADGNFIMVGSTYYWSDSQAKYDWGITIVKADAYGNELNTVLVDIPWIQYLDRVTATSDSGAIAIGTAGGIYIVKINKNGDTSWTKGYGGTGAGGTILQLADGGYMAFGNRGYNPPQNDDFWMLRLDANGDTLWTRRYMNPEDDLGYGLDQTSDGGFVMCGEMYRNAGVDPTDFYIIRTNANGDTLWTKTVGGAGYERSYCIKQTMDGGFIVVGRTDSYGAGSDDFYVVKLAPENPTDVREEGSTLPSEFNLSANYPNPFNPSTSIRYTLLRRARARLEIFDALGRRVRTLVDETRTAGTHLAIWDGTDDAGGKVASGVFLYRLTCDGLTQSRKMILLK